MILLCFLCAFFYTVALRMGVIGLMSQSTAMLMSLPTKPFFFFCFVALRPKSTAMVMAGRSVHLTTLFPGQA